jgi:hypothetical protein
MSKLTTLIEGIRGGLNEAMDPEVLKLTKDLKAWLAGVKGDLAGSIKYPKMKGGVIKVSIESKHERLALTKVRKMMQALGFYKAGPVKGTFRGDGWVRESDHAQIATNMVQSHGPTQDGKYVFTLSIKVFPPARMKRGQQIVPSDIRKDLLRIAKTARGVMDASPSSDTQGGRIVVTVATKRHLDDLISKIAGGSTGFKYRPELSKKPDRIYQSNSWQVIKAELIRRMAQGDSYALSLLPLERGKGRLHGF